MSAVVRRAIGFHLLYVCAVRLASQPQYDPLQQERLHFLDMSISAKIQKIPLVTRFLCLATLGMTGATKVGILSTDWTSFGPDLAFKQFQVCLKTIHT